MCARSASRAAPRSTETARVRLKATIQGFRMKNGLPIQINPGILGGIPVFTGTRVPIRNLFDYLEAGDSLDVFLDDFPSVTKEHAVEVLEAARERLVESARPAR